MSIVNGVEMVNATVKFAAEGVGYAGKSILHAPSQAYNGIKSIFTYDANESAKDISQTPAQPCNEIANNPADPQTDCLHGKRHHHRSKYTSSSHEPTQAPAQPCDEIADASTNETKKNAGYQELIETILSIQSADAANNQTDCLHGKRHYHKFHTTERQQ